MIHAEKRLRQLQDKNFEPYSCRTCGHLKVCAVFRAISPLMESWKDEKPLDSEDLAKICNKYVSRTLQEALEHEVARS